MGHQVADVGGLEFMENGHYDGAVGHRSQIGHRPVGLVLRAKGDAVARLDAASLEKEMQLRDPAGYVFIIKGILLVVRECGTVPVFLERLFQEYIEGTFSGWFLCHNLLL